MLQRIRAKLVTWHVGLALLAALVCAVGLSPIAQAAAQPAVTSHATSTAQGGASTSSTSSFGIIHRNGKTYMDATKCRGMRIHLTGNNQYTAQCLPLQTTQPTTGARVAPSVGNIGWQDDQTCGNNPGSDLEVWADANYTVGSDYILPLCLWGVGWLNFTDLGVCTPDVPTADCYQAWFSNWNDIASSYKSGQWDGDFAWDINMGGNELGFYPNESCPNLGYTHRSNNGISNWNDQISSVEIYTTFSASPSSC